MVWEVYGMGGIQGSMVWEVYGMGGIWYGRYTGEVCRIWYGSMVWEVYGMGGIQGKYVGYGMGVWYGRYTGEVCRSYAITLKISYVICNYTKMSYMIILKNIICHMSSL